MLQIIGYLLCLVLVFQGLHIYQTGRAAADQYSSARDLGSAALVISIIFAVVFAFWLYSQGSAIESRLPGLR